MVYVHVFIILLMTGVNMTIITRLRTMIPVDFSFRIWILEDFGLLKKPLFFSKFDAMNSTACCLLLCIKSVYVNVRASFRAILYIVQVSDVVFLRPELTDYLW